MLMYSVIIPNYNYAEFVASAIDSVLSQSFRDFELIVVDDGSTDGSESVISSYGSRLKAIYTANNGQFGACMAGVRAANGRYIFVLDSDDEMMRDTLEKVAVHLRGSPSKVQFPLAPIDCHGRPAGSPFPQFPAPYTKERMIEEIRRNGSYLTPPTSGNVFRADIFGQIGNITYEKAIDGIIHLICPFLGEVVTLPEALAKYRVHGRNDSGFAQPTAEMFKRSRQRFTDRLDHLAELLPKLGVALPSIDRRRLSYITEHEIGELAIAGRNVPRTLIIRDWRALMHAAMPLRAKLAFALWAAGILVAPASLRPVLVSWRFNPWSRPSRLRWVKKLIGR